MFMTNHYHSTADSPVGKVLEAAALEEAAFDEEYRVDEGHIGEIFHRQGDAELVLFLLHYERHPLSEK